MEEVRRHGWQLPSEWLYPPAPVRQGMSDIVRGRREARLATNKLKSSTL
jgi:hypothetical protein